MKQQDRDRGIKSWLWPKRHSGLTDGLLNTDSGWSGGISSFACLVKFLHDLLDNL